MSVINSTSQRYDFHIFNKTEKEGKTRILINKYRNNKNYLKKQHSGYHTQREDQSLLLTREYR